MNTLSRRGREPKRTYAIAKQEAYADQCRLHNEISALKSQVKDLRRTVEALSFVHRPAMKIPTINQGLDGGMEVHCRRQPVQQDWEDLKEAIAIHLRNLYKGPMI